MNPAVTIVLPVHNVERRLRSAVWRILDLAESASRQLQLAIVDDGSTDETFEAACELARLFPQVRVIRQPYQRGLAAALELVRRRMAVDHAIVHDGTPAIDVDELAAVLNAPTPSHADEGVAGTAEGRGSRRFAAAGTLSARLDEPHRPTSSFRWLRLEEPVSPRRKRPYEHVASPGVMGAALLPSGESTTFTPLPSWT